VQRPQSRIPEAIRTDFLSRQRELLADMREVNEGHPQRALSLAVTKAEEVVHRLQELSVHEENTESGAP
jgi:hypothetical protein